MGTSVGVTKIAGKKRPVTPKQITGASTISASKWDYTDGNAQSNIDRGQDPTYAMPRDAVNSDLRYLGSPLCRLIGDEFCANAESQIFLLADLTALVGTGPLTNNNGVTFAIDTSDDESPLWNQTVASLVSASSMYLSMPTASALQVGTSSFTVGGIGFKTSTSGAAQVIFSYGSHVAGKGYWECGITSGNKLYFEIWDGTNTNTVTDAIASRWQDGFYHIPTAIVDKTNSIIYFVCDGVYIGSVAITATNTLTIAGENFYLGASKSSGASITNFFNGSLGLFKLVNNAADYNIPLVWNQGIREACASGTFTIPTTDTNVRLNNKFGTPNTNNAYFYTALNTEDGEYEIQIAYLKGSANGKLDLIIDGNTVRSGLDTYNGSTTYNNIDKTYKIKLSAGYHTIKIYNNGQNGSSSGFSVNIQWINFIKRRGREEGGVDNFLLLGDEINERSNATWNLNLDGSAWYANQMVQNSPADAQYTEGTLFLKGGLYRIDVNYYQQANTVDGKADLWFGNVQILNQFDMSSGSSAHVATTYVYVRLNQGRQDIRLASNGSGSTGHQIPVSSIRGVRLAD